MKFAARLPLLLSLLLMAGCSEEPTYSVSGTVTLDKKPLPEAFVSFIHTENPRESAVAETDANGNYTLKMNQSSEGMLPGKYSVRISTYREANPETDPPQPLVRDRVPKKYNDNTELSVEVKADQANVINFDLKSY